MAGRRVRRILRVLAVAGALAAVAALVPGSAGALGTGVYRTDGVEGRMETYASQVSHAHIWDLQVIGRTIYAAGIFTTVVDSSDAWPRYDQPFLAAFDTVTGNWVSSFRPRLDRPVYALEPIPSGALVAAGEFTQANGAPAAGIVALDPTTGATVGGFRAGVRRTDSGQLPVIRDLERRGNSLYAVGNFNKAFGGGGAELDATKAVRFDATTGAPDRAWHPVITGNSAWAVAVSADGRRVHLGGEFAGVNGRRGTAQLATVSARDGAIIRGWDHGSNARFWPSWPVGGVVFDLAVWRNRLFVAGAEHYWEMRDSGTGRSLRFQHITNDAQTAEVVGDRVYIGCHCYHRDPARQLWEVNARTGRPYAGSTGALVSGDGIWATAVAPDHCVWVGGDIVSTTRLVGQGPGSYWVGRLARLCPPGGPEGAAEAVPTLPDPVNPPGWRPSIG